MDPTTSYSVPTQHEYCSGKIKRLPLRNIEEGVKAIQSILQKNLLCLHDVDQIDRIYRQIDLLERQVDQIPQFNSQHVLEKVIEKVQIISSISNTSSRAVLSGTFNNSVKNAEFLISSYCLKDFIDKNLPVKNCFDTLLGRFKKDPQTMKNIANYLPTCGTEAQFDHSVTSLIGPNASDEILKVLDQKRKNIQNHINTKQVIKDKKLKLENLRKNNPNDFPDYFDELLKSGCLHLYDHIIEMRALSNRNDRQSAIEKKTFSLLSQVVLETRQSIIQKVESSIPYNCPNIVFLLGGSGSGKSTTFCFLRRDEMILKDFHYESKSDRDSLIGHGQATSCTFLPRVELVNDWVMVDFPGFDDSNGPFISLGMECALKALIAKYQPKILIIESITNTEGRFTAAAQLGSRLQRLLNNKKDCLLGITKYSKDPDFGHIRIIEEQQKKERLFPTPEEITLTAEIKLLSSLNQESLQPMIKGKQQQLEKMQREKAQQLQETLPETEMKMKSRQNVKERENELLKQIGLAKMIPFDDLQDSARLSLCFTELFQGKPLHVNLQHSLDADQGNLIEHLFNSDLVNNMDSVAEYDPDFKNFEQSVKESSLIHTIFSRSNPEIGQFLHLLEIDPQIVRNYDKKIVGSCITKYMRAAILRLDISLIKVALKEMKGKADVKEISSLEEKFTRLEKYVFGLLGIALSENENSEQIEEKWKDLRKDIAIAVAAVEKDYELPVWASVLMGVPFGIPLGIYTLSKWGKQKQVEETAVKKIISDCSTELEQMYDTLLKLKDLEKLINKREDLDQAFESVEISLDSPEVLEMTMKERIDKVRLVYGNEDWDRRVAFLADGLSVSNFEETLICACHLLNPRSVSTVIKLCYLLNDQKAAKNRFFSLLGPSLGLAFGNIGAIPAYMFSSFPQIQKLKERHNMSQGKVNEALIAAALFVAWEKVKARK